MELSHDLLFFFAALGAFNSLVLGLYLLVNVRRFPEEYLFLSLLLLVLAVRAGFSCLYYFEDAPREFIKLGLSAHLMSGPILYYFIAYSLKRGSIKLRVMQAHLCLIMLLLLTAAMVLSFGVWDYLIRYAIHGVLSFYLIFTGALLWPSFNRLIKKQSHLLTGTTNRVLAIYLAVVLICLGFVVSLYTNYIIGPLGFSMILYASVYFLYHLERKSKTTPTYKVKLDLEEVNKVKGQRTSLMKREKPYRDANLTLEKLSKKLSVSRHFLSQMLNDNLNKKYHDLVTEYRIEDACDLMRDYEYLTLESIAYEVGFNSKSSFFSAFKRLKGSTPAKFRDNLESKQIG